MDLENSGNENGFLQSPLVRDTKRWLAWLPLLHLLFSLLVAACVALLVFSFWFPYPYRHLAGGAQLFWLIIGVDVVCGPLLTWVLFKPHKTRLALTIDLSMVVAIQIGALAYGLHTLSYARPIALVHEVDRFRVVTFADLPETEMHNAPDWAQPWRRFQERVVGIKPARTLEEKLASVDGSLQGVEPSQRPSHWQDYALSVPVVLQRSKPLSLLREKHPGRSAVLTDALKAAVVNAQAEETADPEALRWLPLISRQSMSWVVLIDPVTARVRGYVPLDGFN